MTDREREALIDRLKLASAWAFSMNGVPDDPRDDTPMAAIEDAIAVIAASPWLPLPAEVVEGVAPWDGGTVLVTGCNGYSTVLPARWLEEDYSSSDSGSHWEGWCHGYFQQIASPTHWMPFPDAPIQPLPAPPAGEA